MARVVKFRLNGIKVKVRSINTKLPMVWHFISGGVIVRATRRRMKRKGGVTVNVVNTYYSDQWLPEHSAPQPYERFVRSITTTNRRRTIQREYALGAGVKVDQSETKFPGPVTPTEGPVNSLPLTGVRTVAVVKIGGESRTVTTTAGRVP